MKKTPLRSIPKTDRKILNINPDRKPLTPEKIRELSGWKVSDEEAIKIIGSIQLFCRVLYGIFVRQGNTYIEDDSTVITPLNKAA